MARKGGGGRKKVAIQKIEKQSNLVVTFSKRRSSLFNKASELCVLCGCHIAIVLFSVTQKLYAFGEPSVEAVLNRFFYRDPNHHMHSLQLAEDDRRSNEVVLQSLNQQIADYEDMIKADKGNMDEPLPKDDNHDKKWWLTSPEELTVEEAERTLAEIEEFNILLEASSSVQNDDTSAAVPRSSEGFSGAHPPHALQTISKTNEMTPLVMSSSPCPPLDDDFFNELQPLESTYAQMASTSHTWDWLVDYTQDNHDQQI